MDKTDSEHERRRLAELYAGMADGELESIAQDSASLTETARQALQVEQHRRRPDRPLDQADPEPDKSVEWEDLVVVKQFRDLPEALLAKGSLESAGIETILADDNLVRMDWFISNLVGGIKLCVRPEDANAAMDLLEQPMLADFDVAGVGAYQQPVCPQCESLDISFEALHKPAAYASAWFGVPIPVPRKRWKCHSCGHVWTESNDT